MNSTHYVDLDETYGTRTYKPIDVVIERGDGVWVHDVEGKKYLDCLSAYSAVNQGHCHPKIKSAMIAQMDKVTLTSRAFRNDQMGPFLKELCELTGYEMVLPMNTGAEGVESAVKAARKWGYKVKGVPADQAEIIVCNGNFHGRTTTIVGFSSEAQYKKDFGPFAPGFKLVDYGDVDALRDAITPNTVGFLFEPIQGEGGVVLADYRSRRLHPKVLVLRDADKHPVKKLEARDLQGKASNDAAIDILRAHKPGAFGIDLSAPEIQHFAPSGS